MKITKDTLPSLHDVNAFLTLYPEFCCTVLDAARLAPHFAPLRLVEAHGAWVNDMNRVEEREEQLQDGLDHFKQCGHLAFWLRRMSPVVEAIDTTQNLADAEGLPVTSNEEAFRNLLFGYLNEYLAFDFCYQICRFYESGLSGGQERVNSRVLSADYYRTMCHFLKYKTVSPHSLFLIYKSIFV